MSRLEIRKGEELLDALRRVLQREPTLHDFAKAWGAKGDDGESIVRPRKLMNEIYDQNHT